MGSILCGDCLELMKGMESNSVDLVFCSPPYEAARTYGIAFKLKGQEWVEWAVERFVECVRVCRGLVAWNVEGQTRQFRWSATPALFMADLHRRGVKLRKPPIFARVGIPGSGGPDWLRNDYEFVVCGTSGGKLPWSDNTAMGHPPKWGTGGAMSSRKTDGSRNQWGGTKSSAGHRRSSGEGVERFERPSHRFSRLGRGNEKGGCAVLPVLANPGNIVRCKVGGGLMGSKLAHENEAPFPEGLPEAFIRSFCPPDGVVLDPFCGSGTTLAVAERWGRKYIGIDVRQSQVELSTRRVAEVEKPLLKEQAV